MRKRDEIDDPNSCLNKAKDHEILFVLIGRDEDAPGTIRDWIARRVKRGKNKRTDPEIIEAEMCARSIELDLKIDRRTSLIQASRFHGLTPSEQTELSALTGTIIHLMNSRFPAVNITAESLDHFTFKMRGNR